MNNNIQVKSVDVLGDTIVAAKDKKGQIWAGVSYFCKALGMSGKQRDNQVAKVQNDKTLKQGTLKFQEGIFDPNNETVGIKIDFIPLWLAKIQITDRLEKEHPELAEKLLNYQLKAKDILADAFIEKRSTENPVNVQRQIQLIAQGTTELYEKVETLTERMDKIELDLPILPIEADRITEAVRRKGVSVLGGKGSPAYNNRSIRQRVYMDIYGELKRQFSVNTYKSLQRKNVQKAIDTINEYKAPLFLNEAIGKINF